MGQLLNGVLTMDVELEDPTGHVWNLMVTRLVMRV